LGLLASTMGRLYSSALYALRDTRTPLRFAVLRVALATALGYAAAMHLPASLGIDQKWGTAGLTAASGLCGWIEFALLRGTLNRRLGGRTGLPVPLSMTHWACALTATAVAWAIRLALPLERPVLTGLLVLVPYGITYLGMTAVMRVPEARMAIARVSRAGRASRR
jgi:putative peptidoglycan lipid II flippase